MTGGDDNIQSKWTADFSSLMDALQEAQGAAQRAFEGIAKEAASSADGIADASKNMEQSFEGVGEAVESLRNMMSTALEFTGIGLAIEALEKLEEVITETTSRGVDIGNMAQVINLTTDQFQVLQDAAAETGVSFGLVEHAATRLNELLNQAKKGSADAADKLMALGVSGDQIAHANLNDVLQIIHERLESYSESAAEAAALTDALGARAASVVQALREYSGSEEDVAKKMAEFNGLSKEQIKDLEELHAKWQQLEDIQKNTEAKAVASASTMGDKIKSFMNEAFAAPDSESVATPDMMKMNPGVDEARDSVKQLSEEINQTSEQMMASVAKSVSESMSGIERVTESQREGQRVDLQLAQEALASDIQMDDKKVADAERVAAATSALYGAGTDKARAAAQQATQVQAEYSLAVKNFADSVAEYTLGVDARVTNEKAQMSAQINQLNQENAREGIQWADQTAKGALDAANMAFDAQTQAARDAYSNMQISATAEYAAEVAILNKKLQAERVYYATKKQLAAGDIQAQMKVEQEELAATNRSDQQMLAAHQKLTDKLKQQWSGVTSALSSSLSSGFSGMLEGTESFSSAMESVMRSLVESLIEHFVEMGVEWAANALFGEIATNKAAQAEIKANAGVAASGAMASVAAIPYIGWAMAPAIGDVTYAQAMSYTPSAESGYDIPAGVNPVTQLHEREMVLPAGIAQGMRNIIAAQSMGGVTGIGGDVDYLASKIHEGLMNIATAGAQNADAGNGRSRARPIININAQPVGGGLHLIHQDNLVDAIRQAQSRFQF